MTRNITRRDNEVTAITVVSDTRELIERCYNAFRKFHPGMMMIIVDGSTKGSECQNYVKSLASPVTKVVTCNNNIGHGRGMHLAINYCKTPFALIFDSDTVMIKSPVIEMLAMMEKDTHSVGYMEKTAFDGFEYGAKPSHANQPFMMMMHPFFHLLQVKNYARYAPYVHHGAPCYRTALDIHRRGLTKKICKVFPNLGHTSGKGFVWNAIKPVYVIHDTAGTRKARRSRGLQEIEPGWVR